MNETEEILAEPPADQASIEGVAAPQKKRRGLWIGLGLGLLLALAGAAYFGGKLINTDVDGSVNQIVMEGPDGLGSISSSVSVEDDEFVRDDALPKTAPEIHGVMSRVEDNSIFMNKMNNPGELRVAQSADGSLVIPDDQLGSETEVVVTKETQIYQDKTDYSTLGAGSGDQPLRQKLKEISIDEVSSQGILTVWGRREGDRVIADVILYNGLG